MTNARGPLIAVLDDDPTGTQTVHGVSVYTDWDEATLEAAFAREQRMFYVLTNSRSFAREETVRAHREIGRRIARVSARAGRAALVVSRGDSTLRGHYPAETEALAEGLGGRFDGEVIMPFFPESGRFTKDNIHYVLLDGKAVPAGDTEFARDRTFGYRASHLGEWVEEKTGGRYRAADCLYVPVGADEASTLALLMGARDFQKIIVNAVDYGDARRFVAALWRALAQGKRFLYRTASAFPKALGNVSDRPLLAPDEIREAQNPCGGLIVIGSHVGKTTRQLASLRAALPGLQYYEFSAARALEAPRDAAREAADFAQAAVSAGRTAVVYTSRNRLELAGADGEQQLRASAAISDALTSVPRLITARPRYLIAKGGITSSDVATRALGVRRAEVPGQAAPGVPVWQTGPESRFPGMRYVIFPGNVGDDDTLRDVVAALEAR